MTDPYRTTFQEGDRAYFLEGGKLALVRIERITIDPGHPDRTEYRCHILRRWFPGYAPVSLFRRRFTVVRTWGAAYSGMWHFYDVEEFEADHPEL